MRKYNGLSSFGWIACLTAGALAGFAAEAEPLLGARDVFRAARDRFYAENAAIKPTPAPVADRRPERQPQPKPQTQPLPQPRPSDEPSSDADAPVYRPVVDAPLGLRYALMRQTPSGDAAEADVDSVFRSGDRIRIQPESSDGLPCTSSPRAPRTLARAVSFERDRRRERVRLMSGTSFRRRVGSPSTSRPARRRSS